MKINLNVDCILFNGKITNKILIVDIPENLQTIEDQRDYILDNDVDLRDYDLNINTIIKWNICSSNIKN